jgi:hypothetical protein
MQKDFILVMQNCVQFNSPDSDIVKDARQQALMRPSILRKAAAKHNLFLGEDGTVLEIVDDDKPAKGPKKTRKPRKSGPGKKKAANDDEADAPPKKRQSRGRKKKSEDVGDDDAEADTKQKPRLKIRMGKKKDDQDDTCEMVVKKRRRRKANAAPAADEEADADQEVASPTPRRKRTKANTPENSDKNQHVDSDDDHKPIASLEKEKLKEGESEKENGADKSAIFMDVDYWKAEKEKLDGSFMAARALFTKHGPWKLPDVSTERKFRLIAKSTLVKMDKHDGYDVFAEAVSDTEAPGYSDVITSPMDFGTMREKVESKKYGQGDEAFQKLYEDFLLTFDNCYAFNSPDGEVVEEAARIFALLPETFATAAATVAKPGKT